MPATLPVLSKKIVSVHQQFVVQTARTSDMSFAIDTIKSLEMVVAFRWAQIVHTVLTARRSPVGHAHFLRTLAKQCR